MPKKRNRIKDLGEDAFAFIFGCPNKKQRGKNPPPFVSSVLLFFSVFPLRSGEPKKEKYPPFFLLFLGEEKPNSLKHLLKKDPQGLQQTLEAAGLELANLLKDDHQALDPGPPGPGARKETQWDRSEPVPQGWGGRGFFFRFFSDDGARCFKAFQGIQHWALFIYVFQGRKSKWRFAGWVASLDISLRAQDLFHSLRPFRNSRNLIFV